MLPNDERGSGLSTSRTRRSGFSFGPLSTIHCKPPSHRECRSNDSTRPANFPPRATLKYALSAVWFREGQMIHSRGFLNRREALEAMGLPE